MSFEEYTPGRVRLEGLTHIEVAGHQPAGRERASASGVTSGDKGITRAGVTDSVSMSIGHRAGQLHSASTSRNCTGT